jgi:hypothetical protein
VLYSDLDHVLRWVEQAPDELTSVVTAPHAEDLVVVGRSATAFARSPARLRETEALVNHVYALATGRQADLMFAIRLFSRRAAQTILALSTEDTIANDVEWPLLAEREGLTVGYVAADGLDYRTREDFDKPADERDRDPLAWITRVELAAQHVGVLRRFLQARQS